MARLVVGERPPTHWAVCVPTAREVILMTKLFLSVFASVWVLSAGCVAWATVYDASTAFQFAFLSVPPTATLLMFLVSSLSVED
jgi:hypothetical protein